MLVAVTGGTGFVGSHTTAALLHAGHTARILARHPSRVHPALEPLGVRADAVEVVPADVTDRGAIDVALKGADAVIHCASVYSFDPRRADELAAVNEAGARNVLESAIRAGLDPIVHVSSTLALYRRDRVGDTLTPESPPGDSPHPYSGAKARQEAFAQALQEEGAPVVITNPGGVWGPFDPHDGESQRLVRHALAGRLRFLPEASGAFVDVRDVASVHAAIMEPDRGPRRFMVGGHHMSLHDLVELVTSLAGRAQRPGRVPLTVAKAVAGLGGCLRKRLGIDIGVDPEVVWVGSRQCRVDSSRTEQQLGVTFRPFGHTVRDQLRWMIPHGLS